MAKNNKVTRKLSCAYLYSDGALVEMYKEERDGVQIGETVDITLDFCPRIQFRQRETGGYDHSSPQMPGRLVISNSQLGGLPLFRNGFVRCHAGHVDNGSQKSKELGLNVANIYITCKGGAEVSWSMVENALSSGFTVQVGQEYKCTHADAYVGGMWGYSARVNKISGIKKEVAA